MAMGVGDVVLPTPTWRPHQPLKHSRAHHIVPGTFEKS